LHVIEGGAGGSSGASTANEIADGLGSYETVQLDSSAFEIQAFDFVDQLLGLLTLRSMR
jgi:hypothetical protein